MERIKSARAVCPCPRAGRGTEEDRRPRGRTSVAWGTSSAVRAGTSARRRRRHVIDQGGRRGVESKEVSRGPNSERGELLSGWALLKRDQRPQRAIGPPSRRRAGPSGAGNVKTQRRSCQREKFGPGDRERLQCRDRVEINTRRTRMIVKEPRCLRIGVLGCGPIAQVGTPRRRPQGSQRRAVGDLRRRRRPPRADGRDPSPSREPSRIRRDPRGFRGGSSPHRGCRRFPRRRRARGSGGREARPRREADGDNRRILSRIAQQRRNERPGRPGGEQPTLRPRRRIRPPLHRRRDRPLIAIKAWYHESVFRYTMTDNLQPIPIASGSARRPSEDYGGGPEALLSPRPRQPSGGHSEYSAARSPGSGRTLLRTFRCLLLVRLGGVRGRHARSSRLADPDPRRFPGGVPDPRRVRQRRRGSCTTPGSTRRARSNASRRGTASTAACWARTRTPTSVRSRGSRRRSLTALPSVGANAEDGLAAVRALVAIARSLESGESVRLADVNGGV